VTLLPDGSWKITEEEEVKAEPTIKKKAVEEAPEVVSQREDTNRSWKNPFLSAFRKSLSCQVTRKMLHPLHLPASPLCLHPWLLSLLRLLHLKK